MPTFSGGNAAFTPSTTNDNWTLDFSATAGTFGKIIEFGWGGSLYSSYATTQSTLAADPAGNLHRQDWNGQGGLGFVALPLANPWWISSGVLQSTIACRNTHGTDANASSYHVVWEE